VVSSPIEHFTRGIFLTNLVIHRQLPYGFTINKPSLSLQSNPGFSSLGAPRLRHARLHLDAAPYSGHKAFLPILGTGSYTYSLCHIFVLPAHTTLNLTPGQEAALRAEEANLAAAHILGKGTSGGDKAVIDRAVDHAFLSAFRFAMYISAGMAVTSAIAAALLMRGKKGNEPGRPGPHAGG
jgi:hypothetical protein